MNASKTILRQLNPGFLLVYKNVNSLLSENKNVIIDSTNTTIKSRKKLFDAVKIECKKICYIVNTPYDICIKRLKTRNLTDKKVVPLESIKKYYLSFEIPFFNEGWDNIFIDYLPTLEDSEKFLKDLVARCTNFDQKNIHHNQDLQSHQMLTYTILNNLLKNKNKYIDNIILESAKYHDIGKLYTQTFGTDGNCHYYSHENIGSYELLTHCAIYTDFKYDKRKTLLWLFFINYHMRFMGIKTEKSIVKCKNIFGDELFCYLKLFNIADKTRPE